MCITFLFLNRGDTSIKYKLILINNRDEFYSRKTLKSEVKVDEDGKLKKIYGTDVETKVIGTWLALSKRENLIRIGNLLNLPGENVPVKKTELKGRGPIALNFINTKESIEVYNKELCNICTTFNSFNFLSVEISHSDIKAFFLSNSTKSYVEIDKEQYIGFSNSPLDTPLKKVIAGQERFYTVINDYKDEKKEVLVEKLMDLLKWDEKHFPDDELTRRRGGDDAEHFSSLHVKCGKYGTRTRTIILIDYLNNVDYIEETMANENPENPIWEISKLNI